jgi:glycosyltransferase involved in cell wall biosynthesis
VATRSEGSIALSMTRVLHVARYRLPMLDRKMALIAGTGEFDVSLVRPSPARSLPTVPEGRSFQHTVWRTLVGANPHTAAWRSLTFAVSRLQPDLIHVEEEPDSIGALQVATARRLFAPRARLVVHTWQNVNRHKRWHVWRVLRSVLSQADGVLGASAEAVELIRVFGFRGLAADVPQYGVDLTTFQPAAQRTPSETLSILYAGRLIVQKGLDVLIDAVRGLECPVRLTIVGDGPCRTSLEAQGRSAHLGDRMQFIPRVPPQDLASIMARADIFVLPSRTTAVWKEQYGRVLVEAMACAVPIVGSNSGAIPTVMGDGGLVFPEGNARELAECLRRLATSSVLRRQLGDRGRARVLERYSENQIASRTAEFYRVVLTTRANTHGTV